MKKQIWKGLLIFLKLMWLACKMAGPIVWLLALFPLIADYLKPEWTENTLNGIMSISFFFFVPLAMFIERAVRIWKESK